MSSTDHDPVLQRLAWESIKARPEIAGQLNIDLFVLNTILETSYIDF